MFSRFSSNIGVCGKLCHANRFKDRTYCFFITRWGMNRSMKRLSQFSKFWIFFLKLKIFSLTFLTSWRLMTLAWNVFPEGLGCLWLSQTIFLIYWLFPLSSFCMVIVRDKTKHTKSSNILTFASPVTRNVISDHEINDLGFPPINFRGPLNAVSVILSRSSSSRDLGGQKNIPLPSVICVMEIPQSGAG